MEVTLVTNNPYSIQMRFPMEKVPPRYDVGGGKRSFAVKKEPCC